MLSAVAGADGVCGGQIIGSLRFLYVGNRRHTSLIALLRFIQLAFECLLIGFDVFQTVLGCKDGKIGLSGSQDEILLFQVVTDASVWAACLAERSLLIQLLRR